MTLPTPPRWSPLLVRLPAALRSALATLARRDGWPLAGLVRHAVQELLRREGLWPPPAPPAHRAAEK